MTALAIPDTFDLIPADASKDRRHRLALFQQWLADTGQDWYRPDLAAYRDYLLKEYTHRRTKTDAPVGLSPSSVSAHLSTIRGRYRQIAKDNHTRDRLYAMTPADASLSDRKAMVDEFLTRLANSIDPTTAPVKIDEKQDEADDDHVRLTRDQAAALAGAPGTGTLMGLRDTALIVLALSTGLREAELVNLDVDDLHQKFEGVAAVRVRKGKNNKQRLVPYGATPALAVVEAWLKHAGIEAGPVFRGFYKGGKRVRPSRLTVRAVNQILDRYPLLVDGVVCVVEPHDLRRTYARLMYDAGVPVLSIQQNLGHKDQKTTERYIGNLDGSQRQPPSLFSFDVKRLA